MENLKGLGNQFYAHELLYIDFHQLIQESKRQEEIEISNVGESLVGKKVYNFLATSVIPEIKSDDWIFEAARIFAENHVYAYFPVNRIMADRTIKWQTNLLSLKDEVVRTLLDLAKGGKTLKIKDLKLRKISDFIDFVLVDKLSKTEKIQIDDLLYRTTEQEIMQLTVTIKNISDLYEMGFPRIFFVVRRVLKKQLGLPTKKSDGLLLQPADHLDWYSSHFDEKHELYPIIGDESMQKFWKTARNVSGHHKGLRFNRDSNEIVLDDLQDTLVMPFERFQQNHRYLVYLCDYGTRAILAAFCEVEQGDSSNRVYKEYDRTFPPGFPSGDGRDVKLYNK